MSNIHRLSDLERGGGNRNYSNLNQEGGNLNYDLIPMLSNKFQVLFPSLSKILYSKSNE